MLFLKILIFVLLLLVDQYTKHWAETVLRESDPITVLNSLFELHYSQNTGMAFSFLSNKPDFLMVLVIVILVSIIYYVLKEKSLDWSIVFILAGGLGNLIDRFHYGYVVDFINPLFVDFAIFNIADIALNIGVFILLIKWIAPSFACHNER